MLIPENKNSNLLTLVGMCAATVVFVFTTFETHSEAQDQKKQQAEIMEIMNQKIDSLHDDLKDFRKDVSRQFEHLSERHR